MRAAHKQLGRILRVSEEVIEDIESDLGALTGKRGVIESIVEENKILVDRVLSGLRLDRDSPSWKVYKALIRRLTALDEKLSGLVKNRLQEKALELIAPPKGFFIKKDKAADLLEKRKPYNLLNHFGYHSVRELIDREGFASTVSALRFTQSTEWMHSFFTDSYRRLQPGDFEEREVEVIELNDKWVDVARKFLEKKYHNVSHLKEFGVIFVIPFKSGAKGEALRVFMLLLHYLHEVPFYSRLFKKFSKEPDFTEKLKSLLRGDVLSVEEAGRFTPHISRPTWLVIQRYLAKDDRHDLRLFLPHVNPEAEHWFKAQQSLSKLGPDFEFWEGLDFAGDYFDEELLSFDLIDSVMMLVKRGEVKYLFHQQEALWNKIFIEYFGRDKMNELIEENIIKGYIEL